VIHRDLTPRNVMVGAFGEVQVMDWGLAKVLKEVPAAEAGGAEASAIATVRTGSPGLSSRAGDVLGTPAYMAPEQARGEVDQLDERTDVFGLGGILCVILTGQPPYRGTGRVEVEIQAARGELAGAVARLQASGADGDLVRLATDCLAAERGRRPRNAGEVAQAVAAYLAGVQERLRRAELERAEALARAEVEQRERQAAEAKARAERRARRLTLALASVGFLLVGLVAAGAWYIGQQQAEEERRSASVREEGVRRAARLEADLAEFGKHLGQVAPEEALAKGHLLDLAQKALELAESRLDGLAGESLPQRVGQAREDLRRLRREQEMLARLDEARIQLVLVRRGQDPLDRVGASRLFGQAFRWYGIDVERLDPGEAARRVRSSPLRARLVDALDFWARVRFWPPARATRKEAARLLAVADKADPSAWGRRLRKAAQQKDAKTVRRLAEVAKREGISTPRAVLLAWDLLHANLHKEALEVLEQARVRHANDFWIYVTLASVCWLATPARAEDVARFDAPGGPAGLRLFLATPPRAEEAARYWTAAVALRPKSAIARASLGNALAAQKKWAAAVAAHREAIRLKPDFVEAHAGLAIALGGQNKLAAAVAASREAVRLKPDSAEVHSTLGVALAAQNKPAAAVEAFKEAIRLKPGLVEAHYNLGRALMERNELDAAVKAFRRAIVLSPQTPVAHYNLSLVLLKQNKLREAALAARRAILLKPDDPYLHYYLGLVRQDQIRLAEAEAAYREAIRLKPDYPQAHCNLGAILQLRGRFAESLVAYRRGHELGSKIPGWRYPSAGWVRTAERFVELDKKWPGILKDDTLLKNAAERVWLAKLSLLKRWHSTASGIYADVFAGKPSLAEDTQAAHRYDAACAAALAGTSRGEDPVKPDDKERIRWRKQALDWLRAELAVRAKQLRSWWPEQAKQARWALQYWQRDPDLAGVRDEAALAKLPEDERKKWQKLWADVANLLKSAQPK
jgi:serine/threonine-protein kinase